MYRLNIWWYGGVNNEQGEPRNAQLVARHSLIGCKNAKEGSALSPELVDELSA